MPEKNEKQLTYNVFGGTLTLTQPNRPNYKCPSLTHGAAGDKIYSSESIFLHVLACYCATYSQWCVLILDCIVQVIQNNLKIFLFHSVYWHQDTD